MKKIISFFAFTFLLLIEIHSINNKTESDSICHDLCLFLVEERIITEQYLDEYQFSYRTLLYIWDISEKDDPFNNGDLSRKFGIYKFDYSGLSGELRYVLIKNEDSYKIYRSIDVSLIINELLLIRDKSPELMGYNLFDKYLKEITEFRIKKLIFYSKIGNRNLLFVTNKDNP